MATAKKTKEPKTRAEKGTRELITRTIRLEGLTPIMFARYPGDNDTQLQPWQKLYLGGETGRTICLPSENIMSFLSAQNTDSAPKALLEPRKYKAFCAACASFVVITPPLIPFTRDGEEIIFGQLDGERDALSGVYLHRAVARLEKGIPNPQVRPTLPLPWTLTFTLELRPNQFLQEQQLMNVFTEGMIAVGLGTFRRRFGKAQVFWGD